MKNKSAKKLSKTKLPATKQLPAKQQQPPKQPSDTLNLKTVTPTTTPKTLPPTSQFTSVGFKEK